MHLQKILLPLRHSYPTTLAEAILKVYFQHMQRIGTITAVLVIFMAGFMSVCAADENCATEATHASLQNASDTHVSSAPSNEAKQDHCCMLCHVAPHNLPQTMANTFKSHHIVQNRITSTDDTISLGLYTVLDQPPRA